MRPSQKVGIEPRNTEPGVISRSSHRPARTAEATPSGMPTTALIAMAASASSSDAGQNFLMSSITGLLLTIERPKSPWSALRM